MHYCNDLGDTCVTVQKCVVYVFLLNFFVFHLNLKDWNWRYELWQERRPKKGHLREYLAKILGLIAGVTYQQWQLASKIS